MSDGRVEAFQDEERPSNQGGPAALPGRRGVAGLAFRAGLVVALVVAGAAVVGFGLSLLFDVQGLVRRGTSATGVPTTTSRPRPRVSSQPPPTRCSAVGLPGWWYR